jgi:hypothetical protein
MAEIRLDDVTYPLVDAENNWRVVSQSEVLTDIWDEWVEMGHSRRFRGGYYYSGGFDPTSGVLRLPPYYHANNNNQLSTGYGYFFEVPGPSAAALTEDTTAGNTTGSDTISTAGDSITFSQDVTAGNADRILIVSLYSETTSGWSSSVTYAGLNVGLVGVAIGTTIKVGVYCLLDPPTGTHNVVIRAPGTIPNTLVYGASVWYGVNQSNPYAGSVVTNTGTSSSPSLPVSTGAGQWIFHALGTDLSGDADRVAPGTNETQRWEAQQGSTLVGYGGIQDGDDDSSGIIKPTLDGSANWAIVGLSLQPATAPFVYCADGDMLFKYTYDSDVGITEVVALSGTADSATASTLVDAAPAWADNAYNTQLIEITGGTGVGQRRRIVDTVDAGNYIDISPDWDTTPDATSTYNIYGSRYINGTAGRPVYANGKWYIPVGDSINVRRGDTIGATVDSWVDAGFAALHMCTYQNGAQAGFARAHTTNKVDITYDTGDLSDWSGDDFPVGDTSTKITDLNEFNGELIVSKEDVAYQFDSEGTSRPIGTFKNRAYVDADNGRGTKIWIDRAFIPSNQGLDRYVIGQRLMGVGVNRIPGFRDVPGITSPRNRRHAYVEAIGHSIYVQLNGGELTGLLHARHREAGDPTGGELVYNHVLEIPLSKGMYVDSRNNLWSKGASASETDRDIRVIELDDNGGLQKALRRGQASSVHEFWFDETDFTHPDESKQFASLMIETSNWATGASLQASIYRDDGSVEDVGSAITSATLTELTWTVGTSDTGRRGRLRLALTTDGTYTPLTSDPLILHVTAKARTPTVYEGTIDASPEALVGHTYDAAETLKMLRRLVSAGFKNVGEPDVETQFTGEVVAVRERMIQRGDKQEAYEIPVLIRRWVVA